MSSKISQLPAAAALTGTEYLPIVQNGATVKITVAQALALVQSLGILPTVQNFIPLIAECITDQAPVISGATVAVNGIITGSTVINCAAFAGVRLRITRGNIPLPGIDPQDGGSFFTKNLADGFCTLNTAIAQGEYFRIETVKTA